MYLPMDEEHSMAARIRVLEQVVIALLHQAPAEALVEARRSLGGEASEDLRIAIEAGLENEAQNFGV
ncbi:hypothetical protein [Roseomonas elaeocarpi]|uniref:Uncharacterized protein n=1 Tax=Roseomonas elaeocarpi TaxID=907779 RepID=A0ABV6JLM0_9PROT